MRRELVDGGELIARYEYVERAGNRVLDWVELLVGVERAVPVFVRRFQGHRIAGSAELGRALEAAGAIPSRHAHRYDCDPSDVPPDPPEGVRLTPVDRPARDLLDAFHAGYAPGHVDLVPGEDVEAELTEMLGELDAEAQRAGRRRTIASSARSWCDEERLILHVFRDPAYPGTGAALIRHALNTGPLNLVVTDGNPAERLYGRLGFTHTYEAYSVDL